MKKWTVPSLGTPLRLPFGLGGNRAAEAASAAAEPAPPDAGEAVVEAGWMPPLDLLREKRRELELEPLSGLLVRRPELLRKGLGIGGLILGISAGLCALLLIWHQLLKARMGQLERYEADVEQLTKTLAGHRTALKKMQESNEKLVKRLADVRSSSALLADLQLRVPEGVQLTEVQMQGSDAIRLAGVARDPVAFGRVNAMELVLRNSPLFEAKGVTLSKAERLPAQALEVKSQGPAKQGVAPQKLELPSAVRFEMSAALTPLAANRLVNVMEALKAEGMARRLQLLEREGLLP